MYFCIKRRNQGTRRFQDGNQPVSSSVVPPWNSAVSHGVVLPISNTRVKRRKLKLKAKFESRESYWSFKR